MARDNQKNGFFIQDGLLYRHGQVNGEKLTQLCLPSQRISTVLNAHDMPFGSHMAVRRTNDRIAMSFSCLVRELESRIIVCVAKRVNCSLLPEETI